ncbi:MAG: RloB domain-containing protein [Paraburkholderia sp.]|uniref:RloB family protein n=1 Tax=Paraburkholderia sp. TaxID=1926495 RepID=UPI0012055D5F|nr:RloB family protein [Paraburkholderia sp.]TAL96337.1 MAG: RloB domain-containing protein [Paraburkholderia sp.]
MTRKFPQPPSLRRSAPTQRQRAAIYVVCEGKVTEPRYLDDFYRRLQAKPITLARIQGGAGEPLTIVKRCVELKKELARANRRSAAPNDQIWAVFDRDEHTFFDEALRLAAKEGIYLAVSNPCIEVWGLLHHGECDRLMGRAQAQRLLSDIMPGYHHEKSPYFEWSWCESRIADACANADRGMKKRDEERRPFPTGCPVSNFHQLLRALQGK